MSATAATKSVRYGPRYSRAPRSVKNVTASLRSSTSQYADVPPMPPGYFSSAGWKPTTTPGRARTQTADSQTEPPRQKSPHTTSPQPPRRGRRGQPIRRASTRGFGWDVKPARSQRRRVHSKNSNNHCAFSRRTPISDLINCSKARFVSTGYKACNSSSAEVKPSLSCPSSNPS